MIKNSVKFIKEYIVPGTEYRGLSSNMKGLVH